MIILLELHGTNETLGNVPNRDLDDAYYSSHEYHDLETHAVFETAFVCDLVEGHDDEDGALIIPLPQFIERDAFIEFCNHLVHYQLSAKRVGFGKYSNLTYKGLHNSHIEYVRWGQEQNAPSGQLAELLDWVASIDTLRASWTASGQEILRIAKYFQVDICSGCGRMSTEVEQIQLDPCHRTRWPNITNIPVWDTVVARFAENDNAGKRRGWREAWDAADRDAVSNGRTVCLNDDLLCRNCIGESVLACRGCKEWECERCRQDTESEVHFRRWHEDDPRVEEDCYGRRGPSPYHNLDVQACFICRRRICKDNECKAECYECHRRACMGCKRRNDLKSWCGVCRHQIEELGDDEIGPQDREEWICRNCFDSEPHFCGCGEPSYDPNAPESDNESRSSEWHDYF